MDTCVQNLSELPQPKGKVFGLQASVLTTTVLAEIRIRVKCQWLRSSQESRHMNYSDYLRFRRDSSLRFGSIGIDTEFARSIPSRLRIFLVGYCGRIFVLGDFYANYFGRFTYCRSFFSAFTISLVDANNPRSSTHTVIISTFFSSRRTFAHGSARMVNP